MTSRRLLGSMDEHAPIVAKTGLAERSGWKFQTGIWVLRGILVAAATWALPRILTATWIHPLLDNAWLYSVVFALSVLGLLASFGKRGL